MDQWIEQLRTAGWVASTIIGLAALKHGNYLLYLLECSSETLKAFLRKLPEEKNIKMLLKFLKLNKIK